MSINSHVESQYRVNVALASLILGAAVIGILSLVLDTPESRSEISASAVLLDRASSHYPWTLQNLMLMVFFVGAISFCWTAQYLLMRYGLREKYET